MAERPKYSTAPFKEPDHSKKKRKAAIWCPYCGEWRMYKTNHLGLKACPECTISTNDFWVKTANKLWGFGIKPGNRKGATSD